MNALKMPLVFGCVGLGAFALFVFWAESSWRNDLHGRVQEHVRAITDAVHDGDEQRSDDYLRLAADSYYYESILVHRGDTPAFIAIRGPRIIPDGYGQTSDLERKQTRGGNRNRGD